MVFPASLTYDRASGNLNFHELSLYILLLYGILD